MTKAKCMPLILLLLFAAGHVLPAQTIRMERVDRPPSTGKDHFVTATQPFSILVLLSDITDVKGVFFELQWSNAGAIHFDSWAADGSFPATGITVPPVRTNQVNGTGSLSVAAQISDPVSTPGLTNPPVIRLNFVVTSNALNGSRARFSFVKPEAVIGGVDRSIQRLSGVQVSYDVHGFVDVWPGDANNDRIVDHTDWSVISQFFDDGDPGGRIRGFPREPASTIWAAQRGLSWDSVRVTYADCDGSGKIDNADFLVVMANFDRTHVGTQKKEPRGDQVSAGAIPVPVRIDDGRKALGLAGRISWSHVKDKYRVLGVEPGPVFANAGGRFVGPINHEDAYIDFAIGHFNPHPGVLVNGIVAYLLVEPEPGTETLFEPALLQARGITKQQGIFPLGRTTDVERDVPATDGSALSIAAIYPNPAGQRLAASIAVADAGQIRIEVLNHLGRVLHSEERRSVNNVRLLQYEMAVDALPPGPYYLRVTSAAHQQVGAFIVSR